MKYAIWKIDDSRKGYTEQIKRNVDMERVYVPCVNGREIDLDSYLFSRNLDGRFGDLKTPGEVGVWLTFINTLQYVESQSDNIITFEDDAILCDRFMHTFEDRISDLPEDFDFFSLFIPRDHHHFVDYLPEIDDNGLIVKGDYKLIGRSSRKITNKIYRPWQRYGGVSMMWSPKGARKALDAIRRRTFAQWDEFVYACDRNGLIKGYTSNPDLVDLVRISGTENSLVH